MPGKVPKDIFLFRMVHHENVLHILDHGVCCRGHENFDLNYRNIGNTDIIDKRTTKEVRFDGYGCLGDYVPFYFSGKTPMLYNIMTGFAGVTKRHQRDIVYIVTKVDRVLDAGLQYFYTDGNASKDISKQFVGLEHMSELHWDVIGSGDFRMDVHGTDITRRLHAEFLVHQFMPAELIGALIVYDQARADEMQELVNARGLQIKVKVDDQRKYYFQ